MAEVKDKDSNNTFKYIIIFVLFLAVGAVIGFYWATKYLEEKEEEDNTPAPIEAREITSDSMYQDKIKNLYNIVNTNTSFYSSKGVNYAELTPNDRLAIIYNYMTLKNNNTKETLNRNEFGSCDNGFILDEAGSANIPSLVCTVYKYNNDDITTLSKTLFNDDNLSLVSEFTPVVGKKCVLGEDSYVCGNTATPQSGALEIKFDIQKVMLNPDGTIEIYDKGYLTDRRAGVDNPNDQYDNYYLHTSDSTSYYYELKSADNVTFKHTFKTDDNENYYYVSTEIFNG